MAGHGRAGELRTLRRRQPAKGGIPWNDSPEDAGGRPVPAAAEPARRPRAAPASALVGPAAAPTPAPRRVIGAAPRGAPRPNEVPVPDLRPASSRRGSRSAAPAAPASAAAPSRPPRLPSQPRTMFMAGATRAGTGAGAARASHPDPPRRLRGRLPPAARRRQPDRPRSGAAVRRRRLPVAAPRRAIGRPGRRDRPRPAQSERRVPAR